ncbi:TRAP transporter substrate-binding protein [Oceanobacillus jeddahense]|uniref:TRAP transporter substrate-binding protein n=1 Tax=Oceanobacillus jeddahense TaxID=1462527 RepID=UPI000595C880|nr:TRAP transporter substrate-binding protein [Oceanobacillus jeddahense]
MKLNVSVLFMGLFLLAALIGCEQSEATGSSEQEQFTFKLAHTSAPNHHYQTISEEFAELVHERTDGNVTIDIFPSDQLGDQNIAVEGALIGTQDIVLTSGTLLSNWIPEVGVLNLPFLFEDSNHVRHVLDGEIGDELSAKVEEQGALVLAWWENGFRSITNSRQEINEPEDLAGLKIRTPDGEVFLDTFTTLGTLPTPISFGELYSALQLGTVDAQENPPAHIITQRYYEVQDYVSRTNHIHIATPVLMNKELFESMPIEYQDIVKDTAVELAQVHTDMVNDLEEEQWEEIEANGMQITDVDPEPFREATESVYEKYEDIFGADIIERIQDAQNEL